MGKLTFAGVSTEDLDLVVQAPPAYTFPEKDVELQHIPGRNGDVIVDNNCYKNVNRVYSIASVFGIALSRDADFRDVNFIEASEKLIQWLHEHKGYQRLEDNYDPDVYRMAMYKEGGSLVDYYGNATALNVTFECKPQRFLKSGEAPVVSEGNSTVITNPTYMPSSPEIKLSDFGIDSSHVLMMSITNNSNAVTSIVTINSFPSNYDDLIIDSDKQLVYTIYNGEHINLASSIHLNGMNFPKLEKANNTISVNKYEKEKNELNTYSNIIDANKKIVYALYKPYETLIDAKKDYVKVKAYTTLIENKQEIYPAEAYSSYCIDRSEHITVESFNNVIQQNCMSINFNSSMFAKPTYAKLQPKSYNPGFYDAKLFQGVILKIKYNLGDIIYIKTGSSAYKLYRCITSYDAKGTKPATQTDPGWDFSWDVVKPQSEGGTTPYWEAYDTKIYTSVPKFQFYGWDVLPSEISIPKIETESDIVAEKQLLLIATEYTDKKEVKYKNKYMYLYQSDLTKMDTDDKGIVHYGAFILIEDITDSNLSSNIIKYVGAIDQTDLESSYTPSENNIAKDYYNGIKSGHNIFDVFPSLEESIGQNHDCTITLYKAKWVYKDDTDNIGHPEIDLTNLEDEVISQKVVYNIVSEDVPSEIYSQEHLEYDPLYTYNKNYYCKYLDLYYICKYNNTTGPFDPTKWDLLPYRQGEGNEIIGVNYINNKAGYFYKETQSGILSYLGNIFNKSGWTYIAANNILESVEWDTRKKEFQYGSLLSKSADYKIERYYLLELPDYEDIVLEDVFVEDENGNPMIDSAGNKINATIKARFTINSVDDNLVNIESLMPLYTGYYKLQDTSGNSITGTNNWSPCTAGTPISVSSYKMKGNKSYRFIFIESAPNYSDEEDFPDWLDPYPVLYDSSEAQVQTDILKLNASYYDFVVKKDAYYRYSYFDNNIAKNTEWEYKHTDTVIGVIDPAVSKRSVNEITEINMIEGDENKFPVSQFEYVSHEENSVDDNIYVIVKDISLETYDPTKTYNTNDIAIYDSDYYECLADGTTGTWDPSKWDIIGIAIEALEFDEGTVYNDGDYCIYGRSVYRCITDNTTGEWSDDNWEFIGNYVKDVGFYYLDDHGEQIEYPGNIPDDWITVRIVKGSKSDFSDTLLEFYPAADGLYKWDVNLEWISKQASSEEFITTGNQKSDTYLYYLSDLPAYTGLDSTLYDYDIEQATNGNPELVTITVKEDGFYKTSNSTNYMYLTANSTLTKMTIYENPTLTHLELDNDASLDNMKITITPRWWKL